LVAYEAMGGVVDALRRRPGPDTPFVGLIL